jgi:hypothetical protein
MFLAYTAKGTGGAADGKGGVPTTVHWVAIPRERTILSFYLTCAEGYVDAHVPVFEELLKSVDWTGK